MSGRAAAFFDFDKTLLDSETTALMVPYMRRRPQVFFEHQPIGIGYVIRLLLAHELYKRHLYPDQKMAVLLLEFFKGRSPEPFESTAEDLYQTCLKPRLAPNVMARLAEHKGRGDVCVLISAGVRYSLEPVVRDLGFDHLLCTELEIGPDGRYTGRARGLICIDEHKRTAALALAGSRGIDLSASYAYGNHQSDLPLLESVGFPVAVEPTEPLRRVAAKRGWPILTYR